MHIETPHLVLRPFEINDIDAVRALGADPGKAAWLPDWAMDEAQAAGLLRRFAACWEHPDPTKRPVVWAITEKASGEVVGHCGVGPKEELGGMVELAYAVSSRCTGRGWATEAAKAAVWWAFARADLPLLNALVQPGNLASRRVLDKLGFVPAGTRRLEHGGRDVVFDLLRLHQLDTPADPEWLGSAATEEMGSFFNRRAGGYEEHMRHNPGHDLFYRAAIEPIAPTDRPVEVLDLGCGTGLELRGLFERAPNARVTCVDLAGAMLTELRRTYADRADQLKLVQASYLDWAYPEAAFDYALSVNTMHHLWEPQKVTLYRNILRSLRPGGSYIEADYMVDEVMMEQYRRRYWRLAGRPDAPGGAYHIDIPFTVTLQKQLLTSAGFAAVRSHLERIQPEWSGAVLAADRAAD